MLSSSDSEDSVTPPTALSINSKYASKFEKEQRYKDLQRTKDLEAELMDDDDSESESEDEDAAALSTELDLEIFKTIKSIREGDKRIYDKNSTWYNEKSDEEEEGAAQADSSSKSKRKTYKDIVRERILEDESEESDQGEKDNAYTGSKSASLAYDREQQALRKSFLESTKGLSDADSDDEEDGILTVRPKTDEEKQQEKQLLKGALDEIVNPEAAPEGDKFLYDYMLNKKWNFPKDDSRDVMFGSNPYDVVDEDEDETDIVDKFESKYNFRFEELNDGGGRDGDGGISVVGHARSVEGSVRRVDERRKKARESRQERKEKERRQKEAELRRLKNLKKQELQERLNKILAVGGLSAEEHEEAMALMGEDLDGDWDPEKHEENMRRQFDDNYYTAHENDEEFVEKVKSGRIAADDEGEEGYAEDYYDEDNGDGYNVVDYEEGEDEYNEGADNGEAANADQTEGSILDSLYKLDYEDIVGGMTCRFKYKTVDKEDYGLEVDDILLAEDKALNKFVGLKKLAPYYKKREGVDDASKWSKKRRRLREEIKEKISATETTGVEGEPKKQRKKNTESVEPVVEEVEDVKKKRNRRKKKGSETPQLINKFTTQENADIAAASSMHQKQESTHINKAKKKKKSGDSKDVDVKKRRLDLYN